MRKFDPESIFKLSSDTGFDRYFKLLLLFVIALYTNTIKAQTSQTFTTSGSFTVPCGVTSITVECWGGGGGGARSTTGYPGGGGGGAYASSTLSVTTGTTYNFTIGAGGNGSTAVTNGANGGNTSFGTNLVVAAGGTGGATTGAGGTGGTTAASIGTTLFAGGNGSAGSALLGLTGGAGGGAGSTAAGGTSILGSAGTGGNANGGAGGAGVAQNTAGKPGINYGGGGSGAYRTSGTINGGNGAQGLVKITYTIGAATSLNIVEGFNTTSSGTLPSCWSQQNITGSSSIQFQTNNSNPTTSPYEGTRYVYWNSANIANGNSTRLITPSFSTTGITSIDVQFQWYHDSSNAAKNDGVYVEYSTDGINFTQVGNLITRYSATQWGWNLKTITLPAVVGNKPLVFVGLRFVSSQGSNCSLDTLVVQPTPNCSVAKTLPYTENFETIYLPNCWTTNLVNPTKSNGTGAPNTNATSRIIVSASDTNLQETCNGSTTSFVHNLQAGSTNMIKYNSFSPVISGNFSQGNCTEFKEQLISPSINTSGIQYVQVEFDWLEMERTCFTNINSTNIREGVTVQWSSDGISWESAGYFPRHVVGKAPNGTWSRKTVVLPTGAGNKPQIYIAFLFHSEWGYNMYIDNFLVKQKPNCTASTTWNGSSWSAGAPNSTTNAIINGNYSGSGFTCCSLTLNAPMSIANGVNIEVLDEYSGAGTITIASEGSFIQRNNAAPGPKIILTKNTINKRRYDYIYWGSPIVENITTFPAETDLKYQWNSGIGGGWTNLSSPTLSGKGFITRVKNIAPFNAGGGPISFTFNGTANNGIVRRTILTEDQVTTNQKNYNLISNPYPSAISAREFLSLNTHLGAVYFWTSNTYYSGTGPYTTADYASWNFSGGVSANSQGAPTGFINSGQGFFVRGFENNVDAYFTNTMRVSGNNNLFFKNTSNATVPGTEIVDRYWLTLTNTDGAFNQILVAHLQGATYGMDNLYDASRNSVSAVKLYTVIDNDKFSINGRPIFDINDQIPLGITKTNTNKESFTLTLTDKEGIFNNNQTIYLYDSLKNIYHDLKISPYTVITASLEDNTRFKLTYTTNNTLAVNDPQNPVTRGVTTFLNDKKLKIQAFDSIKQVLVYDINGKEIMVVNLKSDSNSFETDFNYSKGVYIIKTILNDDTYVNQKVVQ